MTLGDHPAFDQHSLEAGSFVNLEPYEESASQGGLFESDPEPDECGAEGGDGGETNADAAAEGDADAAPSEEGNVGAAAEGNADAAAAGLQLLWILGALPPGSKAPEWLPSGPQAPVGQPSRSYRRLRGAAGYHCSHGGYMAPAARNMRGRPPRAKDCRQGALSRPQSGSTCSPTSPCAETRTLSEPGGGEPVLPVERGCRRPFSAPSRSHRVVSAFGDASTTAKDECPRPVSAPTTRPVSHAKRPSSAVGSHARVARPQSAVTARESLATDSELGPTHSPRYQKIVEDFSHRRGGYRNRADHAPVGGQCSLKQRARGHRMCDYGSLWNEARGHKFEQLRLGKRKNAVSAQAEAEFSLKHAMEEQCSLKRPTEGLASQKRHSNHPSQDEDKDDSEDELEEEPEEAVKMVASKSLKDTMQERFRKTSGIMREEEANDIERMAETLSLRLDGTCSAPVTADSYRAGHRSATHEAQSQSVPLSARLYRRPQLKKSKSREAARTVLRFLSK